MANKQHFVLDVLVYSVFRKRAITMKRGYVTPSVANSATLFHRNHLPD